MTPGNTHDDSRPHRHDDTADSPSNRQHDATDGVRATLATPLSAATSESTHGGHRKDDLEQTAGDPAETARFAILAILPAVATLAGVGLGAIVGFGVFDPATPGVERAVAYALLVPYFLLGLAGTRWLYEDATRLDAADTNWQPNPWHYVVGGGLALELYYVLPVVTGAGPETGVVSYLAGGLVLALVLSSVVAGPVYVLQRRRRIDSF